jgi:hypothetical protein
MNDYTGKLLHQARHDDLLKEARGGWLLEAARQPGESRSSRSVNRRLATKLAWAVLAALLAMLVVSANPDPRDGASTGGGSAPAVSQVYTVDR